MAYRGSYTAGTFAMQLEGSNVGSVQLLEGGEAFGEVVDETPVGVRVGKHLGNVGYEPIAFEVGGSMATPFYNWVAAMLDGSQTPKDGAILMLDYSNKEQSRLEWTSALVTEVGLPAADVASKEAARMRITIQPVSARIVAGSGSTQPALPKATKDLLESNFRFSVSGLEPASAKVFKVASLIISGGLAPSGSSRPFLPAPGVLNVPNIVFWLPASEASPFFAWSEDFLIKGNNAASDERTASLVFLDRSLQSERLRVELKGLGIIRISNERQEEGAEAQVRVRVESYCEEVRLTITPARPASPATPPASGTAAPMPSAESLATALATALQGTSVTTFSPVRTIAERLLASIEPGPADTARARGRAAGREWASEHARLDELEQIAAAADRDDWIALALGEGHSLIAFLAATRVLAADEDGPIDLQRDDFTSGLVVGASDVYREVESRLHEGRSPRTDLKS